MRQPKPVYDLKERTFQFAADCRCLAQRLPKSVAHQVDGRQLIKASGSVGANYLEADEALSEKDFLMRIKISLKEAKECGYWLRLLDPADRRSKAQRNELLQESYQLVKILASIIRKKTKH